MSARVCACLSAHVYAHARVCVCGHVSAQLLEGAALSSDSLTTNNESDHSSDYSDYWSQCGQLERQQLRDETDVPYTCVCARIYTCTRL